MSGAQHVWEHEYYPQFYIPRTDFIDGVLRKRKDVVLGLAWLGELRCGDRSTSEV
jgi:hypothetical protein